MCKRLPAATQTKNLDVVFAAAIGSALDNGVEARNVTTASQNTDTLYSQLLLLANCGLLP